MRLALTNGYGVMGIHYGFDGLVHDNVSIVIIGSHTQFCTIILLVFLSHDSNFCKNCGFRKTADFRNCQLKKTVDLENRGFQITADFEIRGFRILKNRGFLCETKDKV